MTKPIPDGYHSVTPYLIFENSASAIDFYKKALGAAEIMRFPTPGGGVAHAEIRIGDSHIMLADENPQWDAHGPRHYQGSPVSFMLYVKDADSAVKTAVAAGAVIVRPVENQFYGDRNGTIRDPFGYQWTLGTHVEDVSLDEMKKRMANLAPATA